MKFTKKYEKYFYDDGNSKVAVMFKPCFPSMTTNKYISVIDKDSNEVCFIKDLKSLDNKLKDEIIFTLVSTMVKKKK